MLKKSLEGEQWVSGSVRNHLLHLYIVVFVVQNFTALVPFLCSSLKEKLHNMNTSLCSEYECRRRMLIKRLDVTVQSFGWSDRAKARLYRRTLTCLEIQI